MSFKTAMSSIASAKSFFSLAFSSSSVTKPLGLRRFQVAKLGIRSKEGRLADLVMAANIRRYCTRFLCLQNPDDLLIAEPAALQSSVPLKNRL